MSRTPAATSDHPVERLPALVAVQHRAPSRITCTTVVLCVLGALLSGAVALILTHKLQPLRRRCIIVGGAALGGAVLGCLTGCCIRLREDRRARGAAAPAAAPSRDAARRRTRGTAAAARADSHRPRSGASATLPTPTPEAATIPSRSTPAGDTAPAPLRTENGAAPAKRTPTASSGTRTPPAAATENSVTAPAAKRTAAGQGVPTPADGAARDHRAPTTPTAAPTGGATAPAPQASAATAVPAPAGRTTAFANPAPAATTTAAPSGGAAAPAKQATAVTATPSPAGGAAPAKHAPAATTAATPTGGAAASANPAPAATTAATPTGGPSAPAKQAPPAAVTPSPAGGIVAPANPTPAATTAAAPTGAAAAPAKQAPAAAAIPSPAGGATPSANPAPAVTTTATPTGAAAAPAKQAPAATAVPAPAGGTTGTRPTGSTGAPALAGGVAQPAPVLTPARPAPTAAASGAAAGSGPNRAVGAPTPAAARPALVPRDLGEHGPLDLAGHVLPLAAHLIASRPAGARPVVLCAGPVMMANGAPRAGLDIRMEDLATPEQLYLERVVQSLRIERPDELRSLRGGELAAANQFGRDLELGLRDLPIPRPNFNIPPAADFTFVVSDNDHLALVYVDRQARRIEFTSSRRNPGGGAMPLTAALNSLRDQIQAVDRAPYTIVSLETDLQPRGDTTSSGLWALKTLEMRLNFEMPIDQDMLAQAMVVPPEVAAFAPPMVASWRAEFGRTLQRARTSRLDLRTHPLWNQERAALGAPAPRARPAPAGTGAAAAGSGSPAVRTPAPAARPIAVDPQVEAMAKQLHDMREPPITTRSCLDNRPEPTLDAREDLLPLLTLAIARHARRPTHLYGNPERCCAPILDLSTPEQRQVQRAVAMECPAPVAPFRHQLINHLMAIEVRRRNFAALPPTGDLIIPVNYQGHWASIFIRRGDSIEWYDSKANYGSETDKFAATYGLKQWLDAHDRCAYAVDYPITRSVQPDPTECGIWVSHLMALRLGTEGAISDTHPEVVRFADTNYPTDPLERLLWVPGISTQRTRLGRMLQAMKDQRSFACDIYGPGRLMRDLFSPDAPPARGAAAAAPAAPRPLPIAIATPVTSAPAGAAAAAATPPATVAAPSPTAPAANALPLPGAAATAQPAPSTPAGPTALPQPASAPSTAAAASTAAVSPPQAAPAVAAAPSLTAATAAPAPSTRTEPTPPSATIPAASSSTATALPAAVAPAVASPSSAAAASAGVAPSQPAAGSLSATAAGAASTPSTAAAASTPAVLPSPPTPGYAPTNGTHGLIRTLMQRLLDQYEEQPTRAIISLHRLETGIQASVYRAVREEWKASGDLRFEEACTRLMGQPGAQDLFRISNMMLDILGTYRDQPATATFTLNQLETGSDQRVYHQVREEWKDRGDRRFEIAHTLLRRLAPLAETRPAGPAATPAGASAASAIAPPSAATPIVTPTEPTQPSATPPQAAATTAAAPGTVAAPSASAASSSQAAPAEVAAPSLTATVAAAPPSADLTSTLSASRATVRPAAPQTAPAAVAAPSLTASIAAAPPSADLTATGLSASRATVRPAAPQTAPAGVAAPSLTATIAAAPPSADLTSTLSASRATVRHAAPQAAPAGVAAPSLTASVAAAPPSASLAGTGLSSSSATARPAVPPAAPARPAASSSEASEEATMLRQRAAATPPAAAGGLGRYGRCGPLQPAPVAVPKTCPKAEARARDKADTSRIMENMLSDYQERPAEIIATLRRWEQASDAWLVRRIRREWVSRGDHRFENAYKWLMDWSTAQGRPPVAPADQHPSTGLSATSASASSIAPLSATRRTTGPAPAASTGTPLPTPPAGGIGAPAAAQGSAPATPAGGTNPAVTAPAPMASAPAPEVSAQEKLEIELRHAMLFVATPENGAARSQKLHELEASPLYRAMRSGGGRGSPAFELARQELLGHLPASDPLLAPK